MRFNPTALMGNHPMIGVINAMRSGGDPGVLSQQLLSGNPQLARIAAGKSPQQLMGIAENMCRERGTSVDAVLSGFGIER